MNKFVDLSFREQGKIQGKIEGLCQAANTCRLTAAAVPFSTGAKQLTELADGLHKEAQRLISYMRGEQDASTYQGCRDRAGAEANQSSQGYQAAA